MGQNKGLIEHSKRSERVWGHPVATTPVGVNKLFTVGALAAPATHWAVLASMHASGDHQGHVPSPLGRPGAAHTAGPLHFIGVKSVIHTYPSMATVVVKVSARPRPSGHMWLVAGR